MPTILTPLQNSFLAEFFHLAQDFYLTGGTALSAFYLRHRYSVDLDLFTHDDEAFQRVADLTKPAIQFPAISTLPSKKTVAWLTKLWRIH
jgi:Nucleotidyl transferase AbiEii toxin, Type IV TA system